MDLHDLLLGRTLARITPVHQDNGTTYIHLAFVDRDEYHLIPGEGQSFTDLFINTMHRAQRIEWTETDFDGLENVFEFAFGGSFTQAYICLVSEDDNVSFEAVTIEKVSFR